MLLISLGLPFQDARQRPDAKTLLSHPWIQNSRRALHTSLRHSGTLRLYSLSSGISVSLFYTHFVEQHILLGDLGCFTKLEKKRWVLLSLLKQLILLCRV